jgi:hypothetical protein
MHSVTAEVAGSSPVVPAINQSEPAVYERDLFFQVPFEGAERFESTPQKARLKMPGAAQHGSIELIPMRDLDGRRAWGLFFGSGL